MHPIVYPNVVDAAIVAGFDKGEWTEENVKWRRCLSYPIIFVYKPNNILAVVKIFVILTVLLRISLKGYRSDLIKSQYIES